MKLSLFLLSCLLVGVLAKPSAEVEERQARSAESNSSDEPSSLSLDNLLSNLPSTLSSSLPSSLSEIPGIISSDISSLIPNVLADDFSPNMVKANIEKFLKQINPLTNILTSIPLVGTIYSFVIRIASLPITIVANIVSLVLKILGKVIPGFVISGL